MIFVGCFIAFTTYDEDSAKAADVNNIMIYYLGFVELLLPRRL